MTATTLELSPAARAYLRRATWGLPRARQREVWNELEEHLLTRAAQLQASGIASSDAAFNRALTELGSPARISAGMTGVYLMPKLILLAGTGAVALSTALYALAGGSGGNTLTLPVLTSPSPSTLCAPQNSAALALPVESRRTKLLCYKSTVKTVGFGPLLSLAAIQAAVGVYGGTVKVAPDNQLTVQLPGGQTSSGGPMINIGEQPFISAAWLFGVLIHLHPHDSATPPIISGYGLPRLTLDDVVIQLNTNSDVNVAREVYFSLAREAVHSLVLQNSEQSVGYESSIDRSETEDGWVQHARHRVQTSLAQGEVVLLIAQHTSNNFFIQSGEVTPDGWVELATPQRKLRFVSDPAQLGSVAANGRTPALLIRVTNIPLNQLKAGIFVPRRATSDPLAARQP